MPYKLLYRYTVGPAGFDPDHDTPILNNGYLGFFLGDDIAEVDPNPITNPQIENFNLAVSQCLSFIRKFQAIGTDCTGYVYGQVTFVGGGLPVFEPAYTLTLDDLQEMIYARLDTPDRGLAARINASNKPVTDLLSLPFDDEPEDVE